MGTSGPVGGWNVGMLGSAQLRHLLDCRYDGASTESAVRFSKQSYNFTRLRKALEWLLFLGRPYIDFMG